MPAARRALAAALAFVLRAGCVCLWAAVLGAAHATPKFEDTIAQRAQACTGCHGPQGRAAADGYYPRIAGKPPSYLYNQLLNFRDGRRRYALMTGLLAPLDDAYLREIADYFASLDVAYPAPTPVQESPAVLERGRQLVLRGDAARAIPACVQCHGDTMRGVMPSIPGLLGMPRDYLNAQLGAWKGGGRRAQRPDCMAQVAGALTPQDISSVSAWLAAQPVQGKPVLELPRAMPLACGGVAASLHPAGAPR